MELNSAPTAPVMWLFTEYLVPISGIIDSKDARKLSQMVALLFQRPRRDHCGTLFQDTIHPWVCERSSSTGSRICPRSVWPDVKSTFQSEIHKRLYQHYLRYLSVGTICQPATKIRAVTFSTIIQEAGLLSSSFALISLLRRSALLESSWTSKILWHRAIWTFLSTC
jgi:hypothetical protein